MLKSSIDANGSYAIQNSASRMEAKDSRPNVSVLQFIVSKLSYCTLLIVKVSKFNLSLSVCNLTQS